MATPSRVVILPSDFGLPPLPYLLGLLIAAVATVGVLYRRRPPVTEGTVAALAPWMATGGTLYALYQANAVPSTVAPLFSSPAVYVTVGVLAGAVWSASADRPGEGWSLATAPGILAVIGVALLAGSLTVAVLFGVDGRVGVPVLAAIVVASVLLTGVTWLGLQRVRDVSATGLVGFLAVFGHALDGVSTAIGIDFYGFGEQTPLSRLVIEAGSALPVADTIGSGWLFVLVKLALAAFVVVLFEEYVRDAPTEGYPLLGLVVAVGLGPGFHNLVLFGIA